jgi:CBS domain-containing protein
MSTIRAVMKKDVISVRPETPVRDAVRLLIENRISGLPVIDAAGVAVGVVTEKDLLALFSEDVSVVSALMTPSPQCFDVDAPLVDVVDCLMAKRYRRVLIVERGKLVGLISRADLMPAILEALEARL